MVHTETRCARGRVQWVQRGTKGFLGGRASANDAWAICMSSARKTGVQQKERLGREGEKDRAQEKEGG